MRYKWLNSKKNQKIIVFFNGWGMDESVVEHLKTDDYDVLMFYDYNNLETDFDVEIINNYMEKYLVAWSMGVMTASCFKQSYDSATAINGTLYPIDDKFGIPKKIYNLTVRNFSPEGAKKFIENMFLKKDFVLEVNRDFENQKCELVALMKYNCNKDFRYNKILISDNDKIIPTKNQVNFWCIPPNLHSGHCPFNEFSSWKELL